MIDAADLRKLLQSATVSLRAQILLGLNCAFGATDISTLPESAVDLRKGWIDYPRPKTGIERRCPLWPETVEALRAVIASRPEVKDPAAEGCVFVTRYGSTYVGPSPKGTFLDSISLTFGKLLRKLEMKKPGINHYTLRRMFETVGGETEKQIPVDHIMGHSPPADEMSAIYRQQISDPRLKAVTDHVRAWLWPEGSEVAWLKAEEQREKVTAQEAKPAAKKVRRAK